MRTDEMSTTRAGLFGLIAVAATLGVVLQPWIDLNELGGQVSWSGLGIPSGEGGLFEVYDFSAGVQMTRGLGWIALVAMIVAAGALIGSTRNVPWLSYVAIAFSAVALVAMALPATQPGLIAGQLLYEIGAANVPPSLAVKTSTLWTGVLVTGLMLSFSVFSVVQRRRPRRALRTRRRALRPAPRAGASAAGRAPRPTAIRPHRSSVPTPRTPRARRVPSPTRPRTWCTAPR